MTVITRPSMTHHTLALMAAHLSTHLLSLYTTHIQINTHSHISTVPVAKSSWTYYNKYSLYIHIEKKNHSEIVITKLAKID